MAVPTPESLARMVVQWIDPGVPDTDKNLWRACAATLAYVSGRPIVADRAGAAEGVDWPESAVLASVMIASRLIRRKDSPNGVSVLGADTVAYVARTDPDVSLLLDLYRPAVL